MTRETRIHPDFEGYDPSTCVVAVKDFTHSETELFLIPPHYQCLAKNEAGEACLHYRSASYIVMVRETPVVRRFYTSKKAAELDGWKFSFRTKRMMKETDPEFYGTERILSYHSDARTNYTDENNKAHDWQIGLEVEKEHSGLDRDKNVWKLFTETGWAKEVDGSLGTGGFELVSPILPLMDWSVTKKAINKVKRYVNATYSSNCGGHINLSKRGETSTWVMERLKNSIGILYAIYKSRLTNRYCPAKTYDEMINYPNKYSAIYVKNSKVAEIRLFPAVKNTANLLWRVNLLRHLVQWNTESFVKKMASLKNKNSLLYVHLRRNFTDERIAKIAEEAVQYHNSYVKRITAREKSELEQMGINVNL